VEELSRVYTQVTKVVISFKGMLFVIVMVFVVEVESIEIIGLLELFMTSWEPVDYN
jgi:hypothetical protein